MNIKVNGEPFVVWGYFGDMPAFIKLRDIAYILNGTSAQFDIYEEDFIRDIIRLTKGVPYSVTGYELQPITVIRHTVFGSYGFAGGFTEFGFDESMSVRNITIHAIGSTSTVISVVQVLEDEDGIYISVWDLSKMLGFEFDWADWDSDSGIDFVINTKPKQNEENECKDLTIADLPINAKTQSLFVNINVIKEAIGADRVKLNAENIVFMDGTQYVWARVEVSNKSSWHLSSWFGTRYFNVFLFYQTKQDEETEKVEIYDWQVLATDIGVPYQDTRFLHIYQILPSYTDTVAMRVFYPSTREYYLAVEICVNNWRYELIYVLASHVYGWVEYRVHHLWFDYERPERLIVDLKPIERLNFDMASGAGMLHAILLARTLFSLPEVEEVEFIFGGNRDFWPVVLYAEDFR